MYRITAFIILAIIALSEQSATPLRRSARLLAKNTPKSAAAPPAVHQAVKSDVKSDDDGTALPAAGVPVGDSDQEASVVTPSSSSRFSFIQISAMVALLASIAFGMRNALME